MSTPQDTGHEDEILPYLVYRIAGDQMECALWTLDEGHKSLALFLSEQSATTYVDATSLGPEWKIYQPIRGDLLRILKHSCDSGILFAVLDPDRQTAKRLFDLRQILNNTPAAE